MERGCKMQEITVTELNKIAQYLPIQNLVRVLLKKGYKGNLIGIEMSDIGDETKNNSSFDPIETLLFHVGGAA